MIPSIRPITRFAREALGEMVAFPADEVGEVV